MIGEGEILATVEKVVDWSPADQTEALLFVSDSALTRFANSAIHQNVAERGIKLSIRIVVGKKIGGASTNDIGDESIKDTLSTAVAVAKNSTEDPDFRSLPEKMPLTELDSFIPATAGYSPEDRARAVLKMIEAASAKGLTTAGSHSIGVSAVGIANSLGVRAVSKLTLANLSTIAMSKNSSGYAGFFSKGVREIDLELVAKIATDKALKSQNPVGLEPGVYTVILEADAVADMLSTLAFMGLGALSVQEGRSFMCGKIGQGIVGENITILDDALSPETIGLPFDFEGVPKQRVTLIENGVAKNVVYDSYTAAKEGKKSTGHALPHPNIYGPLPTNLFLRGGKSSLEEMIASTKRGILVTRFHYTNVEDPMKTIFTGMTRDGTFLIEDGKIKRGIKNLRFTQSILEALKNVEMLSRETFLKSTFLGACRVPAMKIGKFSFTGATEF